MFLDNWAHMAGINAKHNIIRGEFPTKVVDRNFDSINQEVNLRKNVFKNREQNF